MKHVNLNIAIIGAGPCGLTTAKNLLQAGFRNIIVFEKNHDLGGNWLYSETAGHSSIYETTHIISSKRLSQFEDFPMPAHYPDYPSHKQLLQYFRAYAQHYAVTPHIRFGTTVTAVQQTDNNRWQVIFEDKDGAHVGNYDVLFVANGHHWDPLWPEYPGQFNGQILHARQYKKANIFAGRRVLVVGAGNSACDIAVEISRVAEKVSISHRSGQHIVPKFIFGKPTDVAFHIIRWLPLRLKSRLASWVIRMLQGRYSKYHLADPSSNPLVKHPTINSELLYFIRHGKIAPLPAITSYQGNQVLFSNGHTETFDTIIYATGYHISFPFFAAQLIDFKAKQQIPLYHNMIHPEYEHLFFIGLFQPQGCIWSLADHQAKLASCYLKRSITKPISLHKKIEQQLRKRDARYHASSRHALEVDYHQFRQQLLREIKNLS